MNYVYFLLLTQSCSSTTGPGETEPPPIEITKAVATLRPMPDHLDVTGSLLPSQRADIAADATGRVLKTRVERGDRVKSGEPLVELDATATRLARAEARATLGNAEVQLSLSASQCGRNDVLLAGGAITNEEWERVASQCKLAQGNVDAAKAREALAARAVDGSSIRAPFAGAVSELYVHVGEFVQPPTRVLSLVATAPLRLQFALGERDVGRVFSGQEVTFQVEAFPDEVFTGTVSNFDPIVRSGTRDFVVEATVANDDERLRPGMSAAARITLPDLNLVTVPTSAVQRSGSTSRVWVVVDGVVQERIVETDEERDGYAAIPNGLQAGEHVVVAPDVRVRDGVRVE